VAGDVGVSGVDELDKVLQLAVGNVAEIDNRVLVNVHKQEVLKVSTSCCKDYPMSSDHPPLSCQGDVQQGAS